jgi:uncharacterized protein (TIGR01777 family)
MTGATGLIGRRLMKVLAADGHSLHVLSRHAGTNLPAGVKLSAWDPMKNEPPVESLQNADVVVHLAGEPVAQRWTEESKRKIRDSRVTGTRNLVQALSKLGNRPAALVSASAIGYYGSRGDEVLTENSAPGTGYLAEVCEAWEREAVAAEALGMRVATVRIGIVLDPRGGALQKMLPPFRMGVGGKVGTGRQWMSWIHLDDLAGIFKMAIEKPVQGPVNGSAPNPVVNADFTKALAVAVRRPAIFPVPEFGLKLLFGEMSTVLLGSQRVQPQKAASSGYQFRFPQLPGALADLLK